MCDIRIIRAEPKQRPLVWAMLQSYLRDLSVHSKIDPPDRDGVYAYKYFDLYWQEPKREALIFLQCTKILGFALINDWSATGQPTDYALAEFYIKSKYRRSGFGTYIAREIIKQRHGQWEIAVSKTDLNAQSFWRSVVPVATQEIAGDGNRWSGPIIRLVSEGL
jgi:predicted acetyltransferase